MKQEMSKINEINNLEEVIINLILALQQIISIIIKIFDATKYSKY